MGHLLAESPTPYAYNVTGHGYMEGERFPKPLEIARPFTFGMRHFIPKPDNTSRMVVLAMAQFARDQRHTWHPVGTAFFSTTAEKPPIARTMAQQYRRNLSTRPEVIERPIAPTTVYEAETLRDEAAYRGWTPESLVVFGAKVHMRRIKRAHRRAFGLRAYRKMHFISAEDYLLQEGMPKRYGHFVELVHESYTHQGFSKRETVYNAIDGIPFIGGQILKLGQYIQGDSKFFANSALAVFGGKQKQDGTPAESFAKEPIQWVPYSLHPNGSSPRQTESLAA